MHKKADTGGAYSIWQNAYQLMPLSAFETGIGSLLTSLQLLTHFREQDAKQQRLINPD